ncbi:2-hydroxymuconate tautomerase [Kiloniella antarctica]|uniref:Tautomerase n=1 Tax=Kiloniella antarctica TaxID=1550907 RepID=A0ABW5BF33_9PROT
MDFSITFGYPYLTQKEDQIMPIIRVEMFQGRSLEQKRALVKKLTEETARITGCNREAVYVVIDDVNKENWGAGGILCTDKVHH